MVGYFQVFFVDTLCSGLGTFFIGHERPKPRRAATPNRPLLDGGVRAKVRAGVEAGATLARGWRGLTQCPIGQNLNQRAPAGRLPEVFGQIHIPLFFHPFFCTLRGGRDATGRAACGPAVPAWRGTGGPTAQRCKIKQSVGGQRRAARSSSSTSRSRTL